MLLQSQCVDQYVELTNMQLVNFVAAAEMLTVAQINILTAAEHVAVCKMRINA